MHIYSACFSHFACNVPFRPADSTFASYRASAARAFSRDALKPRPWEFIFATREFSFASGKGDEWDRARWRGRGLRVERAVLAPNSEFAGLENHEGTAGELATRKMHLSLSFSREKGAGDAQRRNLWESQTRERDGQRICRRYPPAPRLLQHRNRLYLSSPRDAPLWTTSHLQAHQAICYSRWVFNATSFPSIPRRPPSPLPPHSPSLQMYRVYRFAPL